MGKLLLRSYKFNSLSCPTFVLFFVVLIVVGTLNKKPTLLYLKGTLQYCYREAQSYAADLLLILHNWNFLHPKSSISSTLSFWNCYSCPLHSSKIMVTKSGMQTSTRPWHLRFPTSSALGFENEVVSKLVIPAGGLQHLNEFSSPFRVSPTLLQKATAWPSSSWLNFQSKN